MSLSRPPHARSPTYRWAYRRNRRGYRRYASFAAFCKPVGRSLSTLVSKRLSLFVSCKYLVHNEAFVLTVFDQHQCGRISNRQLQWRTSVDNTFFEKLIIFSPAMKRTNRFCTFSVTYLVGKNKPLYVRRTVHKTDISRFPVESG